MKNVKERAQACKTAAKVWTLYVKVHSEMEEVKAIYFSRFRELLAVETKAKARACKTAVQARKLLRRKNYHSLADVYYIYRERWVELALAEAPSRALECETSEQVKALIEEFREADTRIIDIYTSRFRELLAVEATAKAQKCRTTAQVKALYSKESPGHIARDIYEARWIELHLKEK